MAALVSHQAVYQRSSSRHSASLLQWAQERALSFWVPTDANTEQEANQAFSDAPTVIFLDCFRAHAARLVAYLALQLAQYVPVHALGTGHGL